MRAATAFAERIAPIAEHRERQVTLVTRGRQHGPITRLASPSKVGELIKPFVFLDYAEVVPGPEPLFGIHPHSGIATLTTILTGGIAYEDTTGKSGTVPAGGLEWMKAGNGVWHDGGATPGETLRLFQLWVALPPAEENSEPVSQYVTAESVQQAGPARVILGRYAGAQSVIDAPAGMNYLHVRLKDGESWTYTPPAGHTVGWLAVASGSLRAARPINAGELAVFEESNDPIALQAVGDTSFVLGSAVKHDYPLVLGTYSVHTSPEALARGEARIREIGRELRARGRI